MKQIAISTINERIAIGIDYLTDAEALATITGISLSILHPMIQAYGFHGTFRLLDTLSLSSDERTRLELVYSICQRIGKADFQTGTIITNPDEIGQLFISELQFEPVETVAIALLDSRNKLIKLERIFTGTVNSAIVYSKDVVRRALLHNAVSVIISHNHPSGSKKPSAEDIDMTRRLSDALSVVDVKLIDHILIANNFYVSLKQTGLF